ncbi:MAG: hypothetical protein H6624_13080 [Bdellovibrionaceae bacterium]|nr:hypothetical protein [Bdellovibrionales bacterium]MCB9085275.1 hypothetical protein [Pseudobdellovibrionaceae bacterium]
MKKLLLILALGLTMGASAKVSLAAGDDPVPWPFASRCPFPWKTIDGVWQVVDGQITDYFEFHVVSTTQTGARIIEVNRYDENMELIATGRGLSPKGQTVVRLAMYNVDPDVQPRSYTAFVGNYVEKDKFSCEHDQVHTVVTVRSYISDKSQDSHYVIEKIKKNECTQQGQFAP